jgi:hypothetical protein
MNRVAVLVAMLAAASMALAPAASAVKTHITVRVIGKDSKFVGTSMGGAIVTIKNAITGELLAKGATAGTTGDTDLLMKQGITRRTTLVDDKVAKYWTAIDIEVPTLLEVTAYGPIAQPQSAVSASVTLWMFPGKPITGGNGVLLELHGLSVDVLAPAVHTKYAGDSVPETIRIDTNVVMLCGCSLTPDGLWDANKFEVTAIVKKDGQPAAQVEMKYAGTESRFTGEFKPGGKGVYEIMVYAYDPANGNTGLDGTTVVIK